MADYAKAIARVIEHEGGYVNDPVDPGGETKYGISKRAYPNLDIKGLSLEDAMVIYKEDYWDKIQGDELMNDELAPNLLDAAVNTGVRRAVKQLQRALDTGLVIDGVIGRKTLHACDMVWEMEQEGWLNANFTLERIAFYHLLVRVDKVRKKYIMGWIARALSYR